MKHTLLPLILLASLPALPGCRDEQPLPLSPGEPSAAVVARFAAYDVQVLDVAIDGAAAPKAQGINDAGDIVGYYTGPDGLRGFVLSGGEFETLYYPGSVTTSARGINGQGAIVGAWTDGSSVGGVSVVWGFLLSNGVYTEIARSGAIRVIPEDINAAGDISGTWVEESTPPLVHGFVIRNGVFTSFDVPGATKMHAYGINAQGDIVGWYGLKDAEGHSLDRPFIRRADGTVLTDFEGPEPDIAWWGFTDINARGDIVGWYYPTGGPGCVSFVRDRNGHYTMLTTSEATQTDGFSINGSGVVAGATYTPTGAFVAVPTGG
jgi:hypothetical protein